MAQFEEKFQSGIFEVVVTYNPDSHWTWKFTIYKNGTELDQLRSQGILEYMTISDFFRYNGATDLSSKALDLYYKIKKQVPYNELG